MTTLLVTVNLKMKLLNEISRLKILPPYLPRGDYIHCIRNNSTWK